jgi:hypothetical protein
MSQKIKHRSSVNCCEFSQYFDDHMLLTHQVTSPEVAGMISPREMLLLTSWSQENDTYLLSYASTEWEDFKYNPDEYVL